MKTSSRISCLISDSFYKIKAFINESQGIQPSKFIDNLANQYAIIQVKKYSLLEQAGRPYAIVIHVCKKISDYHHQLGKPLDYSK